MNDAPNTNINTTPTKALYLAIAEKKQAAIARDAAVRLVHSAWFRVSGEAGPEAEATSAKLARIKRYLMTPEDREYRKAGVR
jgi:hypothetical protein